MIHMKNRFLFFIASVFANKENHIRRNSMIYEQVISYSQNKV